MKSVKFLIVTILLLGAFVACDKDKSASLILDKESLYFASWGAEPQTISYVESNAELVAVGSISEGWNATVDMFARRIIVTPVGATEEGITNDDLPKEGSMVVNARNRENKTTSYMVNLYISEIVEIDEEGLANCYVVTTPSTTYSFDAMHRPDNSELATARVSLLWQSNPGVIKHVDLVDGRAMFYVKALTDDSARLEDTNGVIAAYNASGEIIWSWHLWIVNENPLTDTDTYSNGKVFMRKNLGAFTNSDGSADTQKILDSYGMYYQWGRKDPFPRPYYFDASGAEDESYYNEEGVYIKSIFKEISSICGVVGYTIAHPAHFITNATSIEEGGDGIGDWLVSQDNRLWSDTEKSLYDPCPYGWRVPTADDLSVLRLANEEDETQLEIAKKQYGWHLSDGVSKYFYSACGRRRYSDGKVENMNYKEGVYPSQPQPWEGYYWTSSTTTDGKAVSLYFDLTTTRTINKFDNMNHACRANGFQIRCVKE